MKHLSIFLVIGFTVACEKNVDVIAGPENPNAKIEETQKLESKPVITIVGENPAYVALGSSYRDAGANASDVEDDDQSLNIDVVSDVNTTVVGTYKVQYSVSDSTDRTTVANRTVVVVDMNGFDALSLGVMPRDKPVIHISGPNPINIKQGYQFVEPELMALDRKDGDITKNIRKSGVLNLSLPGKYALKYVVSDSDGNVSEEVVLTVNVLSLKSPILSVNGANPVYLAKGQSYVDEGASATDSDGVAGAISTNSNVNTDVEGNYSVNYMVTDDDNLNVSASRQVFVVDMTGFSDASIVNLTAPDMPLIHIKGDNPINIQVENAFTPPAILVLDRKDGVITDYTATGSVDINTIGMYTVVYTAVDSDANQAPSVSLVVNVLGPRYELVEVKDAKIVGHTIFCDDPTVGCNHKVELEGNGAPYTAKIIVEE